MNICIKSSLIASLGLFFLYLIIQQVFTLSVEGFEVDDMFDSVDNIEEDHKKKDEDPNTISDKERTLQRKNNTLNEDVAVDDFMLAAEKNRMGKTEAHNIVLRNKLKKFEKENHDMHSHLRKLDNEVTVKDDELSKIESDLFKCLQTQIHPTPTHSPKPKEDKMFGTVDFPSNTLNM